VIEYHVEILENHFSFRIIALNVLSLSDKCGNHEGTLKADNTRHGLLLTGLAYKLE
jgi:hypothetical protein